MPGHPPPPLSPPQPPSRGQNVQGVWVLGPAPHALHLFCVLLEEKASLCSPGVRTGVLFCHRGTVLLGGLEQVLLEEVVVQVLRVCHDAKRPVQLTQRNNEQECMVPQWCSIAWLVIKHAYALENPNLQHAKLFITVQFGYKQETRATHKTQFSEPRDGTLTSVFF